MVERWELRPPPGSPSLMTRIGCKGRGPFRLPGTALTAILCILLLPGCDVRLIGTGISSTDMRVLEAIVKPACDFEWNEIVSDLPVRPFRAVSLGDQQPNLQFGVDVAARSQPEARWPRGNLCASVRVAGNTEIENALKRETSNPPTWDQFRTQFPGTRTLVRVSLPVYSKDERRAVVYTESTCPFRCGNGFFHELAREGSRWKIVQSENAWAL
jgi:hypothetical protein